MQKNSREKIKVKGWLNMDLSSEKVTAVMRYGAIMFCAWCMPGIIKEIGLPVLFERLPEILIALAPLMK